MASVLDYSTTANDNTTVGGVNIAEGMAPGLVNNGMRAMMADTRKWQLDWSGVTTAGAGDAYTLTSNQGITAYADGQRFGFRADRNNTGAATLNIDTRGAKALRKVVGGALAALVADDLVAEAVYDVVYNLSEDVFVIVGFALPTISAFALTLLDDANQGAMQTTLGLVPGTNVQAYNANLASLSGLTLAQGDLLYATAADTLVRLAKGTAGQVLTQNAGETAPEWADPGTEWEDVETLTMTGTTVNTSVFEAGYSYRFLWRGVGHSVAATRGFHVAFNRGVSGLNTAGRFTGASINLDRWFYGELFLIQPMTANTQHVFAGSGIGVTNDPAAGSSDELTGCGRYLFMTSAETVTFLRFTVESGGSYDSGTVLVQKKRG